VDNGFAVGIANHRLMDDVWGFAGFFKFFFQVAENGKKRRKKGEMYIIIYRM
jgi:hypothetical protein